MRGIRDVERTLSRVSKGPGGRRDLAVIGHSLEALPELMEHLAALQKAALVADSSCQEILSGIHLLPELLERLLAAIVEEPPATVKEGGIFRSGYDPDLDELRQLSGSGKEWIVGLQQKEIDRTGIKSLKVRCNSVFGYFIEITKADRKSVV